MRFWWRAILGLLAVAAGFGFLGLFWAHLEIRRLAPVLPNRDEIRALASDADLPVALTVIDTASQLLPRRHVLDPGTDPAPGGTHVMSYPAFVLEWADGRILLVDVGMTPEAALAFGRVLEWVGAEPARPHGSTAAQLGDAVDRVTAVIFSHLHQDHTQGVTALCAARRGPIALFQSPAQASRSNYTTRPGRAQLDRADCLQPRRLTEAPLARVPGYGGLGVVSAAGHTPGSQLVVATVRDQPTPRLYVLSGDVVNHTAGIRHDVPKPLAYRLLVTPESERQLSRLRRFLRNLERQADAVLIVSHHLGGLAPPGLPSFASRRQGEAPD